MKVRLWVTVVTIVCMTLLSACAIGDTTTTATATPDAKTPAPTVAASQTAATGGEERPPLLTDDNVTLPGELPICIETGTLTVGLAQSTNVVSYAYEDNYQTKWMQDRSNVNVELQLFPATDANQKLELMITSNSPLPDIIIGMGIATDAVRYRYGQAGALIALNDYYDQLAFFYNQALTTAMGESDYMTADELLNFTVSPDGNLYGTIYYYLALQNSYANRAWINQKWLDTLDLEIPATSDELAEVLRAFRDDDPNGNGKQDEIPMVGANGGWNTNPIEWAMNQFVYCSNKGATGYYYLMDDGIMDTAFDKDEWREGLRFVKSLVDDGLLSTLSFTQDGTQYNAMVSADPQIVGIGISGSIGGFGANKADYTGVGAIEGPQGVRWATYTPQPPSVNAAITRDCQHPDMAFRWLEMGYVDDYAMITRFGEPGVDWEYADEGTTMYASLGYDPFYKVINNIWGTQQQKMWCTTPLPVIQTSRVFQGEVWSGDESNNEYKNASAVTKLFDYAPSKEDIIYKIIYTDEEIEQNSELRTTLQTYIAESMVRFVMGDLDLDKDWEAYLGELDKLQYKQLLSVDQAAFDRTMGK